MILYKREERKEDGRKLLIYGNKAHTLPLESTLNPLDFQPNPHLRWHPFRQEWVGYAAYRQHRTFKPPAAYCPLCPTQKESFPTEIPVQDFEVAVFDNRFPAFNLQANHPPELFLNTEAGIGKCEVMVYSPDHHSSLSSFSQEHLELIVKVWRDRYQELLSHESIQFVMPFENRGEEVGVTLSHPHGQIYGFSYLPPVVEKMVKGFQEKPILQELRQKMGSKYDVFKDDYTVAFVPPFQRYPYELWLTTHEFRPGLGTFSDAEIASLASMLGKIVTLYDGLFERTFPYIMILYGSPQGEEKFFQFHLQFLPFLRTANKLKYLAGCETGAGTFLVDMLPEETAEKLLEVKNKLTV